MAVALMVLIVWSIIELWVMVQVAGTIGALPTVLAVVAMSVAGLWLMKVEGLGVLRRVGDQLDRGEPPTDDVVDGALIMVGGLLMFVPGFVSGAVGLLLLLPPVRAIVRPIVIARAQRRIDAGRAHFTVFRGGFGGYSSGVRPGPMYDVDSQAEPSGPDRRPGSPPELGS